MNDQLAKNIETIVDEIFKKKEEAEMRKETENALNEAAATITSLNESLEAKDASYEAEVATLKETIASLEIQINEIAEEKKALEDVKGQFDTEKSDLTKRAEAAEEELKNIKKDQIAKTRMDDLRTAGVSSINIEAQQVKVREMTDEEFASYKEELVSIKDSIVKQLDNASSADKAAQKAQADADAVIKAEEAAKTKVLENRLSELKEAGAEVINVAEIEKIKAMDDETFASFKDEFIASLDTGDGNAIDPMKAIAAALNMEVSPNEDLLSKYRALGAAMAENINNRKNK